MGITDRYKFGIFSDFNMHEYVGSDDIMIPCKTEFESNAANESNSHGHSLNQMNQIIMVIV